MWHRSGRPQLDREWCSTIGFCVCVCIRVMHSIDVPRVVSIGRTPGLGFGPLVRDHGAVHILAVKTLSCYVPGGSIAAVQVSGQADH